METITIASEKGGTGKTTTAVNLAAALSMKKKKVLLIDMDPQCNATTHLLPSGTYKNTHDVFVSGANINEVILTTRKNLDIIPSSKQLATARAELQKHHIVKDALKDLKTTYDYVIIDTPPSLGPLTINAFVATDSVIPVVQAHFLAVSALTDLLDTIQGVREETGQEVSIKGILITMVEDRSRLNREIVGMMQKHFGGNVFKTRVPKNITLAEAPAQHKTIFEYNKRCRGAEAYLELAKEVIRR